MADEPALIIRNVGFDTSDSTIHSLFAAQGILVSRISRIADASGHFNGSVIVKLADPSAAAALHAAPLIAQQMVKSGLKFLVGTLACTGHALRPADVSRLAGAQVGTTSVPPIPVTSSDPERLIFRGKQLWDPTSAPPSGGRKGIAGYAFFSTSATFPECMSRMLLGMPGSPTSRAIVERMMPGPSPTLLFLYNATQKVRTHCVQDMLTSIPRI